MDDDKWKARTRRDLIIEIWEHLDCESVGAAELLRIGDTVRAKLGEGAVATVASMARILADEGAELRHAEVLELDARHRALDRYDAMFRNILKFANLTQAGRCLQELENLRKRFVTQTDKTGLRKLRATALKGKRRAQMISRNQKVAEAKRAEKAEIAGWFTIWLQTPELFQDWLDLRKRSVEFRTLFPGDHH